MLHAHAHVHVANSVNVRILFARGRLPDSSVGKQQALNQYTLIIHRCVTTYASSPVREKALPLLLDKGLNMMAACPPPNARVSSGASRKSFASTEVQQFEKNCAELLAARGAGRDECRLDVGVLWEQRNSLMQSAMVARMSLRIKQGEGAAILTADPASTLGFYVAAWRSTPYMLRESSVKGVDGVLETGTLVVDAVLYEPVPHLAPGWFTPSTVEVVVEVVHVLLTGLSLLMKQSTSTTSCRTAAGRRRSSKEEAISNIMHIGDDIVETIMEASLQRDRLTYESEDGSDESESEDDSEED